MWCASVSVFFLLFCVFIVLVKCLELTFRGGIKCDINYFLLLLAVASTFDDETASWSVKDKIGV